VSEVSTLVRGNAAEAAVLHALIEAGIPVLVPFGDGLPFDLEAQHLSVWSYAGERLVAPRNNQRRRIRFAEDYSIEAWVGSLSRSAA